MIEDNQSAAQPETNTGALADLREDFALNPAGEHIVELIYIVYQLICRYIEAAL